jgi:hypothetical protein
VEPDSPEALHYTELILSLCCFAEYLEIDDLADRCVDALRCHEHACGGSLLGRHLQEVYTHTERKSKLRHFIAVSAADFLKNTQDTVEHQASRAAIFALCKSMPQFERDVGEARSVFGKKLEARDKNLDQDIFPACEFHSHEPSGNCHTSDVAGCTLYIGNLLSGTPKENLRTLFTGHGYSV